VAGTAPNVEGEGQATARAPQLGSKTSEETKNEYVVGKSTVTQEDEVGRIKGMSVSILLDFKITKVPKLDEKGQPTKELEEKRVEYTEPEKLRFREMVLNAVGFNAAKGIQLQSETAAQVEPRFSAAVQSMEMWREPEPIVAQAGMTIPGLSGSMGDYIGYGLAGLVALIALIIARGQLKRSHRAWVDAEARARQEAVAAEEAKNKPDTDAENDALEEVNRIRRQDLKEQIAKRVIADPGSAAQIVRKWLYE
jgi:flagellar biosynthesis/type III secretory pathway M-ring protein FliF/YscJ